MVRQPSVAAGNARNMSKGAYAPLDAPIGCDQSSTHSVERATAGVVCILPTPVTVTFAISSCSHECCTEPLCVSTEVVRSSGLVYTHWTVYANCADSLPTSHETSRKSPRSTLAWVWAALGHPKSRLMSTHFFVGSGVEFTARKFAVQVVAASSSAAIAGAVNSAPPMTMSVRAMEVCCMNLPPSFLGLIQLQV